MSQAKRTDRGVDQEPTVHLARDEVQSDALFRKALKEAEQSNAKSLQLRAATSLARLRVKQGKADEARQILQPVYEWFTEGLDTHDLRQAKELLDSLP